MKRRRWRTTLAAFALTLAWAGPSHADEPADPAPRADPRARAQQLFDSALADAESGNFAAACPKFLASQEADPKTSTLLNLANCYEKNGQSASAWGAFREAEVLARKASRSDWETAARTRADALEAHLLRLTIVVADANRVPGLQVTRDDARTAAGEWGVAIPIDPGEHVVRATAEGYYPWERKVTVKEPLVFVDVPKLEAIPPPPPPPPSAAEPTVTTPARGWSTWKTAGAIGLGVGIGGMIGGGLLGLVANSDYDDARSRCRSGATGCPSSAVDDANGAYRTATGATVVFIAGAAIAAAGAALFLFAPGNSPRSTGARDVRAPRVAAGPLGVVGVW